MTQLLSIRDFAAWYGTRPATVLRWIERGKIPRTCLLKLGRDYRVNVQRLCELKGWGSKRPNARQLSRAMREEVELACAELGYRLPAALARS